MDDEKRKREDLARMAEEARLRALMPIPVIEPPKPDPRLIEFRKKE